MAKKGATQNGRDRLEEAIAMLIQNEAAFVSRLAGADEHKVEADVRLAKAERESSECFARIEKGLAEILRILAEHTRMLEHLPDAICDTIGFEG